MQHKKNKTETFTDAEIKIVEKRNVDYDNGKTKTYCPDEFKRKLLKSLKKIQ